MKSVVKFAHYECVSAVAVTLSSSFFVTFRSLKFQIFYAKFIAQPIDLDTGKNWLTHKYLLGDGWKFFHHAKYLEEKKRNHKKYAKFGV